MTLCSYLNNDNRREQIKNLVSACKLLQVDTKFIIYVCIVLTTHLHKFRTTRPVGTKII